jgi:hypothetical protein
LKKQAIDQSCLFGLSLVKCHLCTQKDNIGRWTELKTDISKIEKLFPTVYITLISILLGFAIEDVVNQLRGLAQIDIYITLKATAILLGIFSAWTGCSFISMTQERLPKLLDCVNIFFLSFAIYILNSTLGLEVGYFFAALTLYLVGALFTAIYNFNMLLQNLPTSYSLGFFRSEFIILAICLVIYPVSAWLSMRGMLSSSVEIFLIVCFIVANILWTHIFYKKWSMLILELQ